MMYPSGGVQGWGTPGLASYQGTLWCVWADKSQKLWYAKMTEFDESTGSKGKFEAPKAFPMPAGRPGHQVEQETCGVTPGLAYSQGILHAVYADSNNQLVHYQYDDASDTWGKRDFLGWLTPVTPTILDFRGQLYMVCLDMKTQYFAWGVWDAEQGWGKVRDMHQPWGAYGNIGLFSNSPDKLSLAYASNDPDPANLRKLLIVYTNDGKTWQSEGGSFGKEYSSYGVTAAATKTQSFVAFQENQGYEVYMCENDGSGWQPHQSVAKQLAAFPAAIAVVGDFIHCIFESNNDVRDLLWWARPVASALKGTK
jgi:1-phosphatidylinositol phosphodiesterase